MLLGDSWDGCLLVVSIKYQSKYQSMSLQDFRFVFETVPRDSLFLAAAVLRAAALAASLFTAADN